MNLTDGKYGANNRMNLIYDALLPLVLSGRIEEKKRVFPKDETE